MTERHTTAEENQGLAVAAPVDRVLVFEDRAQITRRAEVSLPAGRSTLRVDDVTPVLADRTLRGRVRSAAPPPAPAAAEGAARETRLLDLQVRRRYLVRASRPEREHELTREIEALADDCRGGHDRGLALLHERQLVERATADLRQQIAERLLVGPFDSLWPEELEQLWRRRAEIEESFLALRDEQEDRERRLAALEEERRLSLQPIAEYRASLIAELEAPIAGRQIVEWEYQVPCALFRPEYRAELDESGAEPRVRFESAGMVWQATGEDWHAVELSCSTARPALGAELPLLEDELLAMRPKTDRERKTIQVSSRDEATATVDKVAQTQVSDTPPGLDDGGEARTYLLPGRVDVPSDGCPHRLLFERWEAAASCEHLCCPERVPFVFRRSLQANPSTLPLLAGPVHLVQGGGYVGRSQIAYVAPGERFELSWGSEDGIVVLRNQVREYEEVGLRNRRVHRFVVNLYLANQSGAPRTLRLLERLPLSELEQVEVELDESATSKGQSKDAQGRVSWQLTLAAGAEQKLRLAFQVRMPQNVHWEG